MRVAREPDRLLVHDLAPQVEALRYRAYTLAKACTTTADSQERLAHARLYVLLDGRSSVAALADAVARKTSWAFHHGGKATATTSASGRTCSDRAAIATQLATSNAPALSQAGHRQPVVTCVRPIPHV
jgi:hypothetical protein